MRLSPESFPRRKPNQEQPAPTLWVTQFKEYSGYKRTGSRLGVLESILLTKLGDRFKSSREKSMPDATFERELLKLQNFLNSTPENIETLLTPTEQEIFQLFKYEAACLIATFYAYKNKDSEAYLSPHQKQFFQKIITKIKRIVEKKIPTPTYLLDLQRLKMTGNGYQTAAREANRKKALDITSSATSLISIYLELSELLDTTENSQTAQMLEFVQIELIALAKTIAQRSVALENFGIPVSLFAPVPADLQSQAQDIWQELLTSK